MEEKVLTEGSEGGVEKEVMTLVAATSPAPSRGCAIPEPIPAEEAEKRTGLDALPDEVSPKAETCFTKAHTVEEVESWILKGAAEETPPL